MSFLWGDSILEFWKESSVWVRGNIIIIFDNLALSWSHDTFFRIINFRRKINDMLTMEQLFTM